MHHLVLLVQLQVPILLLLQTALQLIVPLGQLGELLSRPLSLLPGILQRLLDYLELLLILSLPLRELLSSQPALLSSSSTQATAPALL